MESSIRKYFLRIKPTPGPRFFSFFVRLVFDYCTTSARNAAPPRASVQIRGEQGRPNQQRNRQVGANIVGAELYDQLEDYLTAHVKNIYQVHAVRFFPPV